MIHIHSRNVRLAVIMFFKSTKVAFLSITATNRTFWGYICLIMIYKNTNYRTWFIRFTRNIFLTAWLTVSIFINFLELCFKFHRQKFCAQENFYKWWKVFFIFTQSQTHLNFWPLLAVPSFTFTFSIMIFATRCKMAFTFSSCYETCICIRFTQIYPFNCI